MYSGASVGKVDRSGSSSDCGSAWWICGGCTRSSCWSRSSCSSVSSCGTGIVGPSKVWKGFSAVRSVTPCCLSVLRFVASCLLRS